MNTKPLHMIAFILVIIGGLNWGLYGLMELNLVELLLGAYPVLEKAVYILVGLSALYEVATHKMNCRVCSGNNEANKNA